MSVAQSHVNHASCLFTQCSTHRQSNDIWLNFRALLMRSKLIITVGCRFHWVSPGFARFRCNDTPILFAIYTITGFALLYRLANQADSAFHLFWGQEMNSNLCNKVERGIHRFGISLAMRHRQYWFTHLWDPVSLSSGGL